MGNVLGSFQLGRLPMNSADAAFSNSIRVRSQDATDNVHTSFFSASAFAHAWSAAFKDTHPIRIHVQGSGPSRTMYGVQSRRPYWSRHVSLAPHYLPASPGWNEQLDKPTLAGILAQLMTPRTRSFTWNVRWDHEPLAEGLASLGLRFERTLSEVLALARDYEQTFGRYNATIRNHVRKAHRRGVVVREAESANDLETYYRIHLQQVEQKRASTPYRFIYPLQLLRELLARSRSAKLLVAECEGKIAAGGIFCRDPSSITYLHGASDCQYSQFFPACAVLDAAIRWACESGASWFNFLGSGGISSLERFKSFWGAEHMSNWMFTWHSPLWNRLSAINDNVRKQLDVI
jgi:GNAT acetyltransferase-like protein